MGNSYTATEAARITGIAKRTILFYSDGRTGPVQPDIDPGNGRGATRWFSRRNLFEFVLCRELVTAGVRFDKLSGIVKTMRDDPLNQEIPERVVWYLAVFDANTEHPYLRIIHPMNIEEQIKLPQRIRKHQGADDGHGIPKGHYYQDEFFTSVVLINCAKVWGQITE